MIFEKTFEAIKFLKNADEDFEKSVLDYNEYFTLQRCTTEDGKHIFLPKTKNIPLDGSQYIVNLLPNAVEIVSFETKEEAITYMEEKTDLLSLSLL